MSKQLFGGSYIPLAFGMGQMNLGTPISYFIVSFFLSLNILAIETIPA
jgi:hypothetical protein